MLSLATSIVTLVGFRLVAKKRWEGWAIGLANQALWFALILQTKAWGLLLLNGALVWIYGQALVEWRRSEAGEEADAGGSVEPLVSVPLYSLCDLLDIITDLGGDEGVEGLQEDDRRALKDIMARCTDALVATHPINPEAK